MNPVVVAEIRMGGRLARDTGSAEREFREFVGASHMRILPIDEGTAECYCAILLDLRRRGKPVPTNDLWIAASAMQHGCTVVTLDRHFRGMSQIIVEHIGLSTSSGGASASG